MTAWKRGILLCGALSATMCASAALAAPERLGDEVPDAFPDQAHALSFGYSHESIQLEGPLNDDRVAHDYFKLRYTLNPRTALSFRYGSHDLTGGLGLTTPLFNNRDSAETYTLDLNLNLLNVPATPADPDSGVEFAAGSAFGIGISGTQYQSDMGELTSDDSLLRAYLVYTSDLSPEMRAHTVFSTSRLAGDNQSGSVNRVGAGLDYTLIDGRRPLVLTANGILDVYNFREPEFNTSRISRFDVGLRYRVAEDWYASLGYITVNDSEDDASGSGIYAGVQFVDEPSPPKPVVEAVEEAPLIEETPPAQDASAAEGPQPVEQAPPAAEPQADEQVQPIGEAAPATEAPLAEQAPEVQEEPPAEQAPPPAEAPAGDAQSEQPANATARAGQPSLMAAEPLAARNQPTVDPAAELREVAAASEDLDAGVAIPPFPEQQPRHTPPGAIMARAGLVVGQPHPHQTRPKDVLQRAPGAQEAQEQAPDLIAAELMSPAATAPNVLALDSESVVAEAAATSSVGWGTEPEQPEGDDTGGSKVVAAAGG